MAMKVDFQPAVYEHAARFIGRRPFEVSQDARLMAEAHAAAFEAYGHSPVICGIDLYAVEPEAYGAQVPDPGGDGVPVISPHPMSEIDELLSLKALDPLKAGRLPLVLEAAELLRGRLPSGTDVRIPIGGPFSIAANLLGFENLLLGLAEDPELLAQALGRLARNQLSWAEAILSRGFGVSIFESAAAPPLVSPAQFLHTDAPALGLLCRGIAERSGKTPGLILGGDVKDLVDALAGTGAGFLICPAETDQEAFMAAAKRHPGIRIRLNLDAALVSRGSAAELEIAFRNAIGLIRDHGNAALGTGVLPYGFEPSRLRLLSELAQSF